MGKMEEKNMERRFCGKCGRPVTDCICGKSAPVRGEAPMRAEAPMRSDAPARPRTDFGANRAPQERVNAAGNYYVEKFDNLALSQGEVIVRQYHIGKFAGILSLLGKGNSSILVTNKRVISKSDTNYLFASSNMVEEVSLRDVSGMRTYYAQGITIWRLWTAIIGYIMTIAGLIATISQGAEMLPIFFAGLILSVWMTLTMRKPSYLFCIYSGATSPAMVMGANLRGKLMNAGGYGIVFQYKPTKEAVKMMSEMGACITDLKERGDAAIDTWKRM